ncbi:MAG: hypothetical protein QOE89_3219 [Pseudonocardiales bacterium]|nr:hypothetical protein [Pseudonocardiales bacterium]
MFLHTGMMISLRLQRGGLVRQAPVVMSLIGLGLLAQTSTLLPKGQRSRILWPGLLFIPAWEELAAKPGPLDDVLALTLTVGALVAVQRKHAIACAMLLAWLLWRIGRPAAIVLAVLAVRLLLDPASWSYYAAGLLVGTVLLDLCRTRRRTSVPWFTRAASCQS